jgi:hypothetical protein
MAIRQCLLFETSDGVNRKQGKLNLKKKNFNVLNRYLKQLSCNKSDKKNFH